MCRKFACLSFLLILGLLTSSGFAADPSLDVGQMVRSAKPGQTVSLPAGMFHTTIDLRDGVSLKGAGYGKTVIEADNNPVGVDVRGGRGAVIEDLTINSGGTTGIQVRNSSDVTIRRVVIHGGAMGIRLESVTGARVENAIVDQSLTGVSLANSSDAALVNCTLFNNAAIAMSLSDCRHVSAFNDLVLDAATGVLVSGTRDQLAVDHNLYVASFVGKVSGQLARKMLGPWRDVSGGLDASSVQLPVQLADPLRGDYRPISRLDWSPAKFTVSGWGVAELGGFSAPKADIEGQDRAEVWDVGAFAVPTLDHVAADGSFEIAEDQGTKSAGLFTPDGRLVRYLFQNLPLKKGTYPFVLPTRTQLGEPIAPGEYQLRVVESNLRWSYHGVTANNGLSGSAATTDQQHTQFVCFGPDGALLLGCGWNERGENLRCLDYYTRRPHWSFPGQSMMNGLCVGADKRIYCLREAGAKGQYALSKLDASNGMPLAWADGTYQLLLNLDKATPDGIAELDGTLYAADPLNNRVLIGNLEKPTFDKSFPLDAPARPVADRKRGLVWMIGGHDKVFAVEPSGKIRAELTSVARPLAVAVRNDTLAIASAADGKIHFFDCSDPASPRSLKTLGRGDGPFGPIMPDRFYFQGHAYNTPGSVIMDLGPDGSLALRDYYNRVLVFDPDGRCAYESFAQFGNWPVQAYFEADKATRFFESNGAVSWFVDAAGGKWQPDQRWGYPRSKRIDAVGFFSDSGKQFGVFQFKDLHDREGVLIVRLENGVGKPVAFYLQEQIEFPVGSGQKRNLWVVRHDTNEDGKIEEKDGPATPVLDGDGKPVNFQMNARFLCALPDGSLVSPVATNDPPGLAFVWKRHGLDARAIPVYTFGHDSFIPVRERMVPSAYDFDKTEDLGAQSETTIASNGDYLATFQCRNAPNGMGLSNSGGVDLARIAPDGTMRWFHPLNDFGPIQGIKSSPKFLLTSWGHQAEWIGLDPNGLGLGHLGFPAAEGWTGYWVDHPTQYRLFRGNDGQLQVLVGDYMQNAQHWFSLQHAEDYRSASYPVKVSDERARELAFQPAVGYRPLARPPQPKITIRKLPGAMPIDGSLAKWRGITPQILMTPVAGTGVESPKDASAVVRLAYFGQDLYVQILRFDDVVSFHQPSTKSHLQDTMEMALNGFFEGFQFSVSRFTDTGPAIIRRRFFFGALEARLPADHAPRIVDVLPDAKNVEERKLLESIYGQDMSDCKVIVTEFKLPIDKETYKGDEAAIFPVKSGAGVWIGFAICDNDIPGADLQKTVVWPVTYGTFNVKEEGAWAVFE